MKISKYREYYDIFNNIDDFLTKQDIIQKIDDIDNIDKIINYFYRKKIIRRITRNGITYFISKNILDKYNIDIKTLFESKKFKNNEHQDTDIELEEYSFDEILNLNICE